MSGQSNLTVGDFIELINPNDDTGRRLWLEDCRDEVGEEKWNEIKRLPLTREIVIQLARWIATKISEEVSHWSDMEPYMDTLERGHAFLRDIHQKAVENGINVELNEIDRPLTPSEMMAAAGLVEVDDKGMVKLSPKGERAARSLEQELHPEDN